MSFWYKIFGFGLNSKKQFSGQQPDEKVELLTVFHGILLLRFFIYVLIVIIILVVLNVYPDFFISLPPYIRFCINSVMIILIIHIVGFRLYNHFLRSIIITNHRLIDVRHTVLMVRQREIIPLASIQEFRYNQSGIGARVFGYGDLIIFGASTDVKYVFKYIPHVNKVHNILAEVHQKRMLEIANMKSA